MKNVKPSATDDITTIKITTTTRGKLAKLGDMDDSYESVIVRLIEEHEQNKKH